MEKPYIEIVSLSKKIGGAMVLDDVSFGVEKGEIYGFVGENGSGKTMLFRCICGLLQPTSGIIKIDGKILWKDIQTPPSVGVVIENMGLWNHLTGFENLKVLSKLKKIINNEQILFSISRVGLDPKSKKNFKKYSLGMKQRLVIAQAIMEQPDILILDEPTNGLDENGVELIRHIILEEKQRGATILIASHNKADIQTLCDKTYQMKSGKLSESLCNGGE